MPSALQIDHIRSFHTSTLASLTLLSVNNVPAAALPRYTHISACEHTRQMCDTFKAIEPLMMGPQEIVNRLHQFIIQHRTCEDISDGVNREGTRCSHVCNTIGKRKSKPRLERLQEL
jgi:hypothetical protein